jgi:phenylpropionate dioxygenase-like ring-hydroxylating dioxygenase large terminal subunit
MLPTSLISQIAQTNWIPLCFTNTVPRLQVKEIDLEYRKVGVFKTSEDEYLAIDDRCPHRHGSLCGQRINSDGTVKCPYHGAQFNTATGKCTEFLKMPSSLRLHEYETKVDQDNVLWCKLTDDAVPFPELPYEVHENERAVRGTTDVDVSAFDLVENLCDACHVHEVHSFGNKDDPQPKNMKKIVTSPSSYGYTYDYKSNARLAKGTSEVVHVFNGFYGPFSVYSNVAFSSSMKSIRVSVLPLTSTTSRMFWTLGRDFMTHDLGDHVARQIMLKTIEEDAAVLGQMSDKKPGGLNQVLTKFDWIIAKYRRSVTIDFLENFEGQPND